MRVVFVEGTNLSPHNSSAQSMWCFLYITLRFICNPYSARRRKINVSFPQSCTQITGVLQSAGMVWAVWLLVAHSPPCPTPSYPNDPYSWGPSRPSTGSAALVLLVLTSQSLRWNSISAISEPSAMPLQVRELHGTKAFYYHFLSAWEIIALLPPHYPVKQFIQQPLSANIFWAPIICQALF